MQDYLNHFSTVFMALLPIATCYCRVLLKINGKNNLFYNPDRKTVFKQPLIFNIKRSRSAEHDQQLPKSLFKPPRCKRYRRHISFKLQINYDGA